MDEITKKEMEEALKNTLSYQMSELHKALDDFKYCIIEMIQEMGDLIIQGIKKLIK